MKIGIISDTHDNTSNVLRLIEKLNKFKIDYLVHCGDICSPFTLKLFEKLKVRKMFFVFGNNDGDRISLIKFLPKNSEYFQLYGEIVLSNKKIFLTHFDFLAMLAAWSNKYDYVFFGHTHKKKIEKINKTILINPGEVIGYYGEPTFCILDLKTGKHKFFKI